MACSFGGFTLTYTDTAGSNVGSGSFASLDSFRLTDAGDATLSPPTVAFDLFINQMMPTVSSGSLNALDTSSAVPEPSTVFLMGRARVALAMTARGRKVG